MESNTEPLKIFVGGLSWDTTNDSLRTYFSQFGEVTDAIVMTEKESRKPRGFGFVTFQSPDSIDKVKKEREHNLDGKKIDPKSATTKTGSSNSSHVKKVFVGGLPIEIREDDVKKYFGNYGKVVTVDLKYDKNTERCRGFGFVEFDSPEAISRVLQSQFHQIGTKKVEVKMAEPRSSSGGHYQARSQPYMGATQGHYGYSSYEGGNYATQSYGDFYPGASNPYGYGYTQQQSDQYGASAQHGQTQSSQTSYRSFQPSGHNSQAYNAATADTSYSSHTYPSNSFPSSGSYSYQEGSAYTSRNPTNYPSQNQHGY